jgi:hypothetical protein
VIVDEVGHHCGDEVCELSARVRSEAWDRERFTLWYRVPAALAPEHGPSAPDCSPFLAGLLLWCLRRSEALRIEGPVSRQLLDNVPLVTDVYRAFWPGLMSAIEVVAEAQEPAAGEPVVASFFTRGVDSWYTALTHGQRPYDGPPLTHLVYIPSVDFMFDETHLARSVEATAAAASAAGMTPVVVETNLRRHTERFLHWGCYHGAGLASMGLALGARRVLLPGARSYGFLEPEGSHPLLDPLWSTARTEIVHHGAEATRWDKLTFLAGASLALQTLKVCFDENTDGNCGRCPKCLVTMVMLAAVDALDPCPFDVPLSPARVARLDLPRPLLELLHAQVLPAIHDPRLALALHVAYLRPPLRAIVTEGRAAFRSLQSALAIRRSDSAGRLRRSAR